MIPTSSSVSNSVTTKATTQIKTACISDITEVKTNAEETIQTMNRRVRITSCVEFPSANNEACSAKIILDALQKQAVLRCSVNDGIHTHSTSHLQFVAKEEDPLADGATKKTQTLSYVEEDTFNLTSIKGYKSAILTTTKEFELPQTHQCSNLTQEYRPPSKGESAETMQIPVTCTVENGIHYHRTEQIPMYLPLEPVQNRAIPTGAISFTKTIDNANDYTSENHSDLHDKLEKKRTTLKDLARFQIPRHWTILTESMQQFYIDDIVNCYELGATYRETATRHGIKPTNVRALLLMKLDKIRSISDEACYVKRQNRNAILPPLREMPTLRTFISSLERNLRKEPL